MDFPLFLQENLALPTFYDFLNISIFPINKKGGRGGVCGGGGGGGVCGGVTPLTLCRDRE